MEPKYYSRRKRDWAQKELERRKIEKQRLKYNLWGLLALAVMLALALNLFG